MLVVPVPADDFLPLAIRAIESNGYAGLFVLLARTPDAREQHDEIVRDWTSIHDVTGPLIAVLCPDPSALHDRPTLVGSGGPGITVDGLNSGHWKLDQRDARAMESLVGEYHGQAIRPTSKRAHQDAWSEATSRCARYFGIPEDYLPSLVLLSFWERVVTLIPIGGSVSIYALSKAITRRLGGRPEEIVQAKSQIREATHERFMLNQEMRTWEERQRRAALPIAEWHAQLSSLDRNVALLASEFPELVLPAREALGRLAANEKVGPEVCARLRAIDTTICNSTNSTKIGIPYRRIHNKIWKIIGKIEAGDLRRPLPEPGPNPHRQPLAAADSEVQRLEALFGQLTRELQLSRALEFSLADLYRMESITVPFRIRNLDGWTPRMFRQVGRADLPLRTGRG